MKAIDFIRRSRGIITIILALAGIAIIVYYDACDTVCNYLTGDIWGIDLKWIGITYMAAIICFIILKWGPLVRAALAWGLGVEIFLFSFQVKEDVFCLFCLALAVILIAAFIINYEPSDYLQGPWLVKIFYALGEFTWPPIFKPRLPLLLFPLLGYLFVFFTFTGSTSAYGNIDKSAPFLGSGHYEVFIFSDYFCPPCQTLEAQLEPALEAILAQGDVKVIFIDLPIHKPTILYNRYYLYTVNANPDIKAVLHARRALFELAKQTPDVKTINEKLIAPFFNKESIAFKPFDYRPVQAEFQKIIKQFKVKSTPTCIIKYSKNDIRRYVGIKKIMDGMKTLKSTLYR